jgi:uncharacterized protein with LGFP repeats
MPGRLIYGDIYQAWVAGGGSSLQMGAPSGDPVCGLAQGGCLQKFVHADIAWSPGTGAFAIRKAARYWYENGAQAGLLGYPTGDQTCVAESCEQPFQGGTVVVDPALGTVAVQGPLRDAWVAAGGRLNRPGSGRGSDLARRLRPCQHPASSTRRPAPAPCGCIRSASVIWASRS